MPDRSSASRSAADCASVRYSTAKSANDRLTCGPGPARPLSIEKKVWPPIMCSIAFTTDSASARSVGATWMAMRSCISRTISATGSLGRGAMTCEEALTMVPVER